MKLTRRKFAVLTVAPMIFGVTIFAMPGMAAAPKVLAKTEFNTLATTASTAAEHRELAEHYRAIAAEHESEAKMFEGFAKAYNEGMPRGSVAQSRDFKRAALHYAEHAHDSAEAAIHLAEAHEGFAEFLEGKWK